MANYFGKRRLTQILFNYLEQSAPEKLSKLKRDLKENSKCTDFYLCYKKHRNSEWLNTSIYNGDTVVYQIKIFATGTDNKAVTLWENKVIENDYGEKSTQIFSATTYYDKTFNPKLYNDTKYADLLQHSEVLQIQSIAKESPDSQLSTLNTPFMEQEEEDDEWDLER